MSAPRHDGPLPRLTPDRVRRQKRDPVDAQTLLAASAIVEDVRARGMPALREHAQRLGDLTPTDPIIIEKPALFRAADALDRDSRRILDQAAGRVLAFAHAQRNSVAEFSSDALGARAGQTIAPVSRAGCYAPGGRFPLPSSVLMTVCTARAAGVRQVWAASPRPTPITLAAAAIAGADALLAAGGAQAIAALAYGAAEIPACDVVVGPGNRWVTAAKQLVAGKVGIDMLAGPSEVLIIADDTADPRVIAADALAQCEHDPDAAAWILSDSPRVLDQVDLQIARQLSDLPTAPIALQSLRNGGAVLCASLDEAASLSDGIAPEHLQIMTADAMAVATTCTNFGAVFIGAGAAEVLGDYCLGPNHTLPTGGAARFAGGLSVFNFLRIRTFIRSPRPLPAEVYRDVAAMARMEGLEGHARAAEARAR